MNRYWRLLCLMLFGGRRAACPVLGPCRTPFRVWPTDLDALGHVNNGTYLSLMDLGRVDLMQRSGVLARLRARGWYPVVGEQSIQYRRSLHLGDRFAIVTRVLGWDARTILLEQRFVRPARDGADEEVATAVVRARFLAPRRGDDPGGPLPTADVLALGGHDGPSPELPAWVSRWAADQTALRIGASRNRTTASVAP